MDNELQEVAEHLQENGSDVLSIKLLVDRTKLQAAKEYRQGLNSQTNFYLLILIIWTMILLYYFHDKESKREKEFVQSLAVCDSTSHFKVDSLSNYVDTTFNFQPKPDVTKKKKITIIQDDSRSN